MHLNKLFLEGEGKSTKSYEDRCHNFFQIIFEAQGQRIQYHQDICKEEPPFIQWFAKKDSKKRNVWNVPSQLIETKFDPTLRASYNALEQAYSKLGFSKQPLSKFKKLTQKIENCIKHSISYNGNHKTKLIILNIESIEIDGIYRFKSGFNFSIETMTGSKKQMKQKGIINFADLNLTTESSILIIEMCQDRARVFQKLAQLQKQALLANVLYPDDTIYACLCTNGDPSSLKSHLKYDQLKKNPEFKSAFLGILMQQGRLIIAHVPVSKTISAILHQIKMEEVLEQRDKTIQDQGKKINDQGKTIQSLTKFKQFIQNSPQLLEAFLKEQKDKK